MVTIGAAVLLACGVAIAEAVDCDSTPPCYGTPEDDEIDGTLDTETIYAYGGDDTVYADGVKGSPIEGRGDDTVYGSSGDDDIQGEGGSDTVYGGGGNDIIDAATGDTPGSDTISGGGGSDTIYANDGNEDIINCGKGNDFVTYDQPEDTVKGCENKTPL